jgi:hypothetical protein
MPEVNPNNISKFSSNFGETYLYFTPTTKTNSWIPCEEIHNVYSNTRKKPINTLSVNTDGFLQRKSRGVYTFIYYSVLKG